MVRALFLSVFLLFVYGCSQTVKKVHVKVPSRFVYKPASSFPLNTSARWWLTFHNRELNRLLRLAIENNYDLKVALMRIKQAQLAYQSTKTGLFPEVSLSSGYSKEKRKQGSFKSISHSYSLSLYASYEIDLWSAIRNGVNISLLEKRKAEYYYDSAMITLVANLVRDWIECVASREKLPVVEERLRLAKRRVKIAKTSYLNGSASFVDYLSIRDSLNKLRYQIGILKNGYLTYLNQIKTLAGMPVVSGLSVKTEKLPEGINLPDIGTPSRLLMNRPDVRESFVNLKEAFLRVKIARANRLPSLSLSSQLNYSTSRSIFDIFNNWFYSLAAKIAYVLVDFNRAKLEQKIREVERNSALIEYKNTILKAVEEVENAYIKLNSDFKELGYLKRMVASQRMKTKLEKSRFLAGEIDLGSYLNSEDLLLSYRLQLIDARKQYLEDLVNLYRAAGGCYYHEK